MLPLNGHTVIGEVLTRCWKIPGIDYVACTVPTDDDKLAYEAFNYADVIRGPEHDVLLRYMLAATELEADVVMRITADCPLLSPELCGAVLRKLQDENADYASNIDPRTFPQGMDCEVFTYAALKRSEEEARDDEREHVTTFIRRANFKRVSVASPWPIEGRLTLDTEDDYRVICAAFGHPPYQCLRAA